QQEQLDSTLTAIASRSRQDTAATIVPAIRPRLERAAWADLRCEPCEHLIVPWAGASIAPFAAQPGVRAELERLRDGYEWGESDAWMKSAMTERVRNYAKGLLSPNPSLDARSR